MMNTKDKGDFFFNNTFDIQKMEGSKILLVEKKIILPERRIILEKSDGQPLLQYQSDNDGEFERTPNGIIISR